MKITLAACLIFISIFSGCATVTKGHLDEMTTPLEKPMITKKNQKINIEYRVFSSFQLIDVQTVSVGSNEEFDKAIETKIKQLQDSNINVEQRKNDFDEASFRGSHYLDNLKKMTEIPFPIKNDYLIQFEIHSTMTSVAYLGNVFMAALLAPIHIITLGLVPMTISEEFAIKATLFDKNGKILQENDVNNKVRLWLWTPLIFAGGTSIFTDNTGSLYAPAIGITADHALRGLKFNP